LDNERHNNKFIQDLMPKSHKHPNYTKNLEDKISITSIFLLNFFKRFLEKDGGKCECKGTGNNEKINIPPLNGYLSIDVAPSGFLSDHKPRVEFF